MSGCMNACGHHHGGHIGILGVDKSGEEWYQITIGGAAGADATTGVCGNCVAPACGSIVTPTFAPRGTCSVRCTTVVAPVARNSPAGTAFVSRMIQAS